VGERWSANFVGRGEELERLSASFDNAMSGRASAVVVGGESGVGKTRLITEFLESVRRQGGSVVSGCCMHCGEGGLPYWPFIEGIRGLVRDRGATAVSRMVEAFQRELAWLLPELQRRDMDGTPSLEPVAGTAQLRLFEAVLGLLARLSEQTPVVLVVEDLHWADRSTMDLLAFLLANLHEERVLVIATYRSHAVVRGYPLQAFLAELRRNRRADLVELRPFMCDEARSQLETILGHPPEEDLAASIFDRSEGNPFFAEELLAAATTAPGPGLPSTLRQIMAAQVDVLSEPAQQVLRMLSTGGQQVSHEALAAVAARPEPELLEALRECVAHHVLIADPDGHTYRFRHRLLLEAVYSELLPGERTQFHAAYARTLNDGAQPWDYQTSAKLAYHWEQAGDLPRAIEAASCAAAAAARVYGFAEAQQHYERVLDLWDLVPAAGDHAGIDRLTLFERAARFADMAGEHRRASALMKAAIAELAPTADATRVAQLEERLGRYLRASGECEEALAAYHDAVARMDTEPETAEWARLVAAYAEALMGAGRYRESRQRAEAALTVARRVTAGFDESHILSTLGVDMAFLGDPESGIALLEESRAVAEKAGNHDQLGRYYLNLAELLSGPLNRVAEGAEVAEAGVARVRELGLERSYGVALRAIAVNSLFRLGRWKEADHFLREALKFKPTGAEAIDLYLARVKLSVGRGDFEAARHDLSLVRSMCAGAQDPRYQAPLLTLTAGLAIWEGRLEDARRAIAEGLRLVAESEDTWFLAPLVWHGLRAEADYEAQQGARRSTTRLVEIGQVRDSLLRHMNGLVEKSKDAAPPVRQSVAAYAKLCGAESSRLDGSSSPDEWADVACTWAELQQPYPVAYARWRHAEALLSRRSRSAEATQELRDAHSVVVDLGAVPLKNEIEMLARRARITIEVPSVPAPATPPLLNEQGPAEMPEALAALTKREHEVLALVTEGMSNRQIAAALFISEKTASVHVSHILAKLGVTTRVQASALVHRLGLAASPSA
jgi:DNA-binding CsgD family transcriptional regulator/tetratricopeptide (TPR) repeat protein